MPLNVPPTQILAAAMRAGHCSSRPTARRPAGAGDGVLARVEDDDALPLHADGALRLVLDQRPDPLPVLLRLGLDGRQLREGQLVQVHLRR